MRSYLSSSIVVIILFFALFSCTRSQEKSYRLDSFFQLIDDQQVQEEFLKSNFTPVVAYLSQNLNLLRENGRLVNIGLLGGTTAEINLGTLLGKGLRIIGTRLRARPLAEKIRITREFENRFWQMLEEGRLQPVIDRVFPIEEAQAAHSHVRQNLNIGKVVLEI